MNQAYFIYKSQKYSFDFNSFCQCSNISRAIYANFEENKRYFYLISEFDYCTELSDDSINTFIDYCHNQSYVLKNTNVMQVNFLSNKYDVISLTKKTNEYIKNHYKEIIDEFFIIITNRQKNNTVYNLYENIISDNISDYLSDDRLLFIPIENLYRILMNFKKHDITNQKLKDKIECRLVEFLIKYIRKNGKDASFLFSIFDIGYKGCFLLNKKLSKNPNLVNFEYVNWTIFRSLHYMNIKQKSRKKKEIKKRENLFNTVKDFFQMEQFNQNHNEEENKSISFMKYGVIYTIRSIFESSKKKENIKLQPNFINIKESENNNLKLSKFELLNFLLNESIFSTDLNILLNNKKYIDIISIISKIIKNQQKESVINLFKYVNQDYKLIDFIDKSFPYLFSKNLKYNELLIWIPLIKLLIQNNIHFSIIIDTKRFVFKYEKSLKVDFKVILVMNELDDLSLSKGSKIIYDNEKKSFNIDHINGIIIYYMISDLINKKMETEIQMKKSEIMKIYYSNAHKKFIMNENKSWISDHILSIKDFFNDQNSPIISLIWNLVFTLTEKEINAISIIIHPIESKILKAAHKMFKSINIENAQEILFWNKWAYDFDVFIPTIMNCLNIIDKNKLKKNNKLIKIDSILMDISNTINYLKKPLCVFWNSKDLIIHCQTEYNILNELKNKFFSMIQHFKKIEINDKYSLIKERILKFIVYEVYLTNENYIKSKKMIDKFLADATRINSRENKIYNYINWPILKTYDNEYYTQNIMIFNILINYSKIYHLLINIKEKKNIINNLLKLSKYLPESVLPRFRFINWEHLLKCIFRYEILNENDDENENGIKNAMNILNAKLIIDLFSINPKLITSPNYLCNIINNYSKRNFSNEIEVQWILNKIEKISPDFLITIPHFTPNSIVYLIVNEENKIQPGPLLKSNNCFNIKKFKKYMVFINQNHKSYRKAAKLIGQIIYNITFDKNKIPPQKYDQLKNFFIHSERTRISNIMEKLFLIAESLDGWGKQEFIYDDTFFLSQNKLIYDNNRFNDYPSLLFWFCKNKKCAKELISKYHNFVFNNKKIPFWLVCLRIFSSKSAISFESIENKYLFNTINKAIKENVIIFIDESVEQNKPINHNWINLLLSNVPHKISNNNIKMIHDFLAYISENKIETNIFDEIKTYQCIYDTISELTKLILYNQFNFDEIMKKTLYQFLINPSLYMKIKYNLEEVFNDSHNMIDLSEKCKSEMSMYNFFQIKKLKYLSDPILYCSSNCNILCTINMLKCQIDPIISSYCDSPIRIEIKSYIENKIAVSIQSLEDPQNYQIISVKEKLNKLEPVQIFINPPKIAIKNETKLNIKGNLEFKAKNCNKFVLPFQISLSLLPLKVRIRCIQYPLTLIDKKFQLDCTEIKPNGRIDFEIINYYFHDLFLLNADLESLDGNMSTKPTIIINEKSKQISLRMPHVTKETNCKFDLIMNFCKNFITRIRCDFVIKPLVFAFEVYDYCLKKFTTDSCKIFLSDIHSTQSLIFRISFLNQSVKECRISYLLPSPICIGKTDIDSFDKFTINSNVFTFNIAINNITLHPNLNNNENYGITLEIEQIQKTIKFEFIDQQNVDFNKKK